MKRWIKSAKLLPKRKDKKINHKVKIDKEQVLLGSLLGDGSISFPGRCKNPRFQEGHSLNQRDYLLWKQSLLPFETRYGEKVDKDCYIFSRCLPMLKKYHKWKYEDQITEIITRLNAVGLLIWYLDDGNYHYPYGSCQFSTGDFPYSTHLFIQNWLQNKYGIEVRIRKKKTQGQQYFVLETVPKESEKLLGLFKPYIPLVPENMHYKFGLDGNRRGKAIAWRKAYWGKYSQDHRQEILVRRKKYCEEHKEERSAYRKKHYQEHLAYCKKYHQEHKEELSAYHIKYREEHREENLARNKRYYQEHREELLGKGKKRYQERRKEILAKGKKYRQKHGEEFLARRRKYYQEHKEQINKKRRERCHHLGISKNYIPKYQHEAKAIIPIAG